MGAKWCTVAGWPNLSKPGLYFECLLGKQPQQTLAAQSALESARASRCSPPLPLLALLRCDAMRCDALRCRSSCSTPSRRPLVCSRAHHKLPPQPSPASQPTCLSAPPSMGRGFPSWNAGACSGTVVNGRRGAKAKTTQSNLSLQASGQQQGSRACGALFRGRVLYLSAAACWFLLQTTGHIFSLPIPLALASCLVRQNENARCEPWTS